MTYIETVKKIWEKNPYILIKTPLIVSISYIIFSLILKVFNIKMLIALFLLTLSANFIATIIIFFIHRKDGIF